MFECWQRDQEREVELRRNISVLTGYFSNPQLAQQYLKDMNPTAESTEEEFEESWNMVLADREVWKEKKKLPNRRRKKRIIAE
jgi:hypothetical protein